MNVNIGYDDMTLPMQGPENPFSDRGRFENQNALAGHVEEQAMSEHAFRRQHLTYSVHGYAANPSMDPNGPAFIGAADKAQANGFATVDMLGTTRAQRKELKRKRKPKGDVEVVDGENAYMGPWAAYEGDDTKRDLPESAFEGGEDEEEEESGEEDNAVTRRANRSKAKRGGGVGQETSTFHGKSLTDYQGRTYMHAPLAEAPHLASETGTQECFIPKVCIHTYTGHTQGVSVIRLLPKTAHLFLSGSMDTKIKVRTLYMIRRGRTHPSLAMGYLHHGELPAHVYGSYQSRERPMLL